MKTISRAVLVMTVCAFLTPMLAHAEIRARSVEAGLFGGYHIFENRKNLQDVPLYGARLGFNIHRHFGIEVGVEAMASHIRDRTLTGQAEGQFRSPMDRVHINMYYLNALYHFKPEGPINPFVLVGVGGAHYSPSIATGDMSILMIGAGAKYRLTDRIAFRFDLRDVMVTEWFQETFHNLGMTAGLAYTFGGRTRPPVSAMTRQEPRVREGATGYWSSYRVFWFGRGDEVVRPSQDGMVAEIASQWRRNPALRIALDTFTNSHLRDQHDRRVDAVRAALIQAGVPTGRIETGGYGDPGPRSNARVEVLIWSVRGEEPGDDHGVYTS